VKARRGWAWPLVPLYAAGLAVKDGLRRVGSLWTRRLAWPVVSVGSLSAGGAGKTPVAIALAELLSGSGWHVDVLSRGYGRSGTGEERVDPEAEDAAGRFGDEPVVIARRARVPVWVGADRFAAGWAAEVAGRVRTLAADDKNGPRRLKPDGQSGGDGTAEAVPLSKTEAMPGAGQRTLPGEGRMTLRDDKQGHVHLLDDGFQHRGLARMVDIVLVTAEDFQDALLPAGNRREGLAAVKRADVVVLREEERERVEARVRGLMSPGAVVWSVRRELRFPEAEANANADADADALRGRVAGVRPIAFCAIARPEGFWAMLAGAGCEVGETVAFGDHHAYRAADVERLAKVAGERGATGFITTEKDAVKLSPAMLARLREVGPVCVVGLEAKFIDEAGVVRELEARLR